jgi:transposase-like protein
MDIESIYQIFPNQDSCIKRLEKVRWQNGPECPYCFSKQVAREKSQSRWHCNTCNTSFSVTVNTIFHDTKIPLQKWFVAISLVLDAQQGISAKQLQRELKVTYKTAWNMRIRISRVMSAQPDFLHQIVEFAE